MILSAKTIRELGILKPCREKYKVEGVSGGLSYAGYDIAVDQPIIVPERGFILASSREEFFMPKNVMGFVHDKSSWARRGIMVQNTVIEPGWNGFLTLELTSHSVIDMKILEGTPIAQIVFQFIDEESSGYDGKYQNQKRGPQRAILK